jgi:hypothetical protein
MMKPVLLLGTFVLAVTSPLQAAAINEPPPLGAILDLNGTPIPGGGNNTAQMYTVNFVGAATRTAVTFAFREDPALISFSDVSVVDLTTASGNPLLNGNFAGGVYTNNGNDFTPVNWTYANVFSAIDGGEVDADCGHLGAGDFCWSDGAVQAYDAISQTIATNVGDNYRISFWISDDSGCATSGGPPCNFSRLSTNGDITGLGGNGINVTVYAQSAPGVPEPASLVLVAAGLFGFGWKLRKRAA